MREGGEKIASQRKAMEKATVPTTEQIGLERGTGKGPTRSVTFANRNTTWVRFGQTNKENSLC